MYGNNQDLTRHELVMDPSEIIVTKTEPDGKIRYGNRTFFKFAGYEPSDCIGKQHNIIRHPEMPRTVFKLLWDTIQSGHEIFAYVNNRAKNGDHYWVLAHVTPSRDVSGNILGYHSNRRAPRRDILENHIIPLYDQLLKVEKAASSPKDGLAAGEKMVVDLLRGEGKEFNELMFNLGI